MRSTVTRKLRHREVGNPDDTVVVDMREFFAQCAPVQTQEEATVVVDVPDLQRGGGVRRLPPRRRKEPTRVDVPVPPPLHRALARQRAAVRREAEAGERERLAAAILHQRLEASERARSQLTSECRALRVELGRHAHNTRDSLTRARMQGTIDHLRDSLERAERALERRKANHAESMSVLQERIDESMSTIERLTNKAAHLERERTRAVDRLEDLQMDRAGQAMQIAHLNMSLVDRTPR